MYSEFVLVLSCILGGVALFIAFKILKKLSWIGGWLRGTFGLAFLILAVGVGLVAMDMMSYRKLLYEQPLATLTFNQLGNQHFNVEVSLVMEGKTTSFELSGDQWQMDARILRWKGLIALVGAQPGYRIERVSGRYYSLEDERRKKRSVHPLFTSTTGLDFWAFLRRYGDFIPLVSAEYGSATYLPMADNAIFQVALSHSGLTAKAVNEPAQQALKNWQ